MPTSSRANQRFVAVNCGAVPRDLIESEFFGHTKGAFSGATSAHAGYFEQANNGTLFLDEVGELPLDAQVKLLRVLQEGKVRRLHDDRDIPVDVRIVAATNRNLQEEVEKSHFREDLYYRLAVFPLELPSLSKRSEDIEPIAEHFLGELSSKHGTRGQVKELSKGGKSLLRRQPWPGNVRQLQATLRRAVLFSKSPTISEAELSEALVAGPTQRGESILHRPLGNGFKLEKVLDEVVAHYLRRALDDTAEDREKAARLVGLGSGNTFKNWWKSHKVTR